MLCCSFAVFEQKSVRDFQNFESLFFARANSSDSQRSARAIQKSKSTLEHTHTQRIVRVFSLHTRAYTRTHTHTHTHTFTLATASATVARVFPPKERSFCFRLQNSLSATPGRKSLKKDVLASVQTKRVQDRSGETKVGATETTERNREEEIG